MIQSLRVIVASLATLLPMTATASEAERLASLSKSDFMEEFENTLPMMMEAQETLFIRFDPELAKSAVDSGPITDAERDAMSCLWDKANEQDMLLTLGKQMQAGQRILTLTKERPDIDIVDYFMNPEIVEEHTKDVTLDLLPAMRECGATSASAHRIDMSPEVLAMFGSAAEQRGYQ